MCQDVSGHFIVWIGRKLLFIVWNHRNVYMKFIFIFDSIIEFSVAIRKIFSENEISSHSDRIYEKMKLFFKCLWHFWWSSSFTFIIKQFSLSMSRRNIIFVGNSDLCLLCQQSNTGNHSKLTYTLHRRLKNRLMSQNW